MALGKIDHIAVGVDDLEKAEEYFIKKLGFKLLRRIYEGEGIMLTSPAGDFVLDLHQMTDERRDAHKTQQEAEGGPFYFGHIAFKVDDINKEIEELKSKGVLFGGDPPSFNPMTGRALATAADADGHVWIQLSETKKVD